MRSLYPEIENYNSGFLKVSNLHNIYYEESGNPKGIPVVHLHGGPGACSSPKNRQNYNPEKYRIILFDQRGCGQSTPFGELAENTTPHLIEDIEKLRKHLNIKSWVVSGRSWGSTLAIAYAENYPGKVRALFIGGVFLGEKDNINWLENPNGAASLFPDLYDPFKKYIPKTEQNKLTSAYYNKLNSSNFETQKQAAINHLTWEGGISKMEFRIQEEDEEKSKNPPEEKEETDYNFLITLSKIETHYMINNLFMEEKELIQNAYKIKNIPGIIIHGRYDMVCPMDNAWKLHKHWEKSELIIVPDCGHSGSEPPTVNEIINATDKIATWF